MEKSNQTSATTWEEEHLSRNQEPPKPVEIKCMESDQCGENDVVILDNGEEDAERAKQKDEWLNRMFRGKECCKTEKGSGAEKKDADYFAYFLIFCAGFAFANLVSLMLFFWR